MRWVRQFITSGPALERAILAAMLSNLVEGDVLFIDEIHRIAHVPPRMLYLAMEDFRVDVVVGKGPGATSIPLDVAPFTLVGATTRSGALTGPLRDRWDLPPHGVLRSRGPRASPLSSHSRYRTRRRCGRRSGWPFEERRGSRTGCFVGCATMRRCAATVMWTSQARVPRWPSTTLTSSDWTGSTAPCSMRW